MFYQLFFFKTTATEHKILTLIQFTDIFQWKSGKKNAKWVESKSYNLEKDLTAPGNGYYFKI